MKQLYFLFFLIFGLNIQAQNPDDIVYIPDANFKAKLLSASPTTYIARDENFNLIKIDTNDDGQIQVSEALEVYWLSVNQSNIGDLTGIEAFTNLKLLNCGGNTFMTIDISALVNLETFYCSYSLIPSINLNDLTNLTTVLIDNSALTSLTVSNLPNLHSIITTLSPNLTSLVFNNCPTLYTVEAVGCHLNTLIFNNCTNLQVLKCSGNYLQSLDVSNCPEIMELICGDNQLHDLALNANPSMLYKLNCSFNNLTSLELSNAINLNTLLCHNNQITTLDLSNTRISSTIDSFKCDNNNLYSLFIKNGQINAGHYFGNNPNLRFICIDDNPIEQNWFQNMVNQYGYTNCVVSSYCSFVPGGIYYVIEGSTKYDINNNGFDADDISFPNLKFTINNSATTGILISNDSGNYNIPVSAGTHTITPVLENPNYFTVSPTSTTVSFPSATSPYLQDFCIMPNGVKNDLEITIIPIEIARPGFGATYKIIYKNKGNQVSNGSLNFTFEDTIMDLVSVIPVNTSSANNSLSWNFSNLNPFETREIDLVFNINSPMATPAVNGGDVLVYTATIVGATDETPNDNTFTLNQTVVNSYDPNDKTCLEGATITPSMVGQYVHYVIRFENTGTFAAENIVVADIIDATKFDIATLVPQRSSHDFYTRINGNKVEFIFENINLPFDDANNDGYVAFKIKTKPILVLGDTFTNSASIYFDYNFPIITESASTTVAALNINDFDFGSYFTVYPNPVKDVLNFEVKKEIGVKSISVYNTLGQIVMAITNVDNLKNIDVSSLSAGSYFVKVHTDKGSSSSKFIKQ